MTAEEFLKLRNPGGKSHPSDAYDFSLFSLNHEHPTEIGQVVNYADRDRVANVSKLSGGYQLRDREGDLVAVIHKGVAYYSDPRWKKSIPRNVTGRLGDFDLGIQAFKQVKYVAEVAPLVSPIAEKNVLSYPIVLQHTIVDGEPMTIRAEKPLKKDAGTPIAILNGDGLVVAQASNEWGATLLTVAKEYRSKGLGKLIGQYWYDHNPSFQSGGFTPAGEKNALALWQARAEEFLARGWYSALVREGRLTKARVDKILAEIPASRGKPARSAGPAAKKATGETLVFIDDGITFVVYDRAFLDDQDERFIHGFGFFRDAPKVGSFLYRIDYDRPFADMTTRVALQLARDNGDKLYDGEGYHDMLETDGIPGVVRKDDYITLTRNLLPLKEMAKKERQLRKREDPYGEKQITLLEMAENKWD